MRLPDFVTDMRRKVTEGWNLVRHPDQVISRQVQKNTQSLYEAIDVPGSKPMTQVLQRQQLSPSPYLESVEAVAKTAVAVPIAARPRELQGRGDRYTIEQWLSETATTQLWLGSNSNREAVWIKEYRLLERDFKLEEIKKRCLTFERLVTLNLKIGHGPDFRLMRLIEPIVDAANQRCYLITKPIAPSLTLAECLAQGAMSNQQVREVLRQVLETLRFLHTAYRVRFSADQSERGMAHGNLSLHSLLLRQTNSFTSEERQFFIYATDLQLWEHLFDYAHPIAQQAQTLGSVSQDLQALARIGFYLTGGALAQPDAPLSLATAEAWTHLNDLELKHFLQQLAGAEFFSADAAIQALRLLAPETASHRLALPEPDAASTTRPRWTIALFILLAFATLGVLAWGVRFLFNPKAPPIINLSPVPPCCIQADAALAARPLAYAIESGSAWEPALQRTMISLAATQAVKSNLVNELEKHRIRLKPLVTITNRTGLEGEMIQSRRQSLPLMNRQAIVNQLLAGESEFALMQAGDDLKLSGLLSVPVAYDALVVFVAFSDGYRKDSIPKQLNGQITLEQLRQLYTGALPQLNGKAVKLYFPTTETGAIDQPLVQQFQSLALGQDASQVNQYRQQLQASLTRDRATRRAKKVGNNLYAKILDDFENPQSASISIGFDRVSRMFGQCSVYPLKIVQALGKPSVQLLVQSNGQPIDPQDPTLDLCKDKGSYWVNVHDLKSGAYPLAYALNVVFPQKSPIGSAFADNLNRSEGQYLLSQAGLVPQQPIPQIWKAFGSRYDR